MRCKDCEFYMDFKDGSAACTKSIDEIDDMSCLLKLNIVATTALLKIMEEETNG